MTKNAVSDFAVRLRALRAEKGWKIADVARMTGLAISTISKVENGRMSLTYDKLMQLAHGLSLDLADLLKPSGAPVSSMPTMVTARRSIARKGEEFHIAARSYDYWYLNTDLARKAITPILGEARAKTIGEFGELLRHAGEEFVYVLEGSLIVHTEFYNPARLEEGDSVYIDSTMGHAYLVAEGEVCRFLSVCTEDGQNYIDAATEASPSDLVQQRATAPARRKSAAKSPARKPRREAD